MSYEEGGTEDEHMIGRTWRSEFREFKDTKTVRTIEQLTSAGNYVHLYFTEYSFYSHRYTIFFRSVLASR